MTDKTNPIEVDASELLPLLTEAMDAAFRMGHHSFKNNAKFVIDSMNEKLGSEATAMVKLNHLQAAYINMGVGTDDITEVAEVTSVDDILRKPQPLKKFTMKYHSKGSLQTNMVDALKEQNPKLYRELCNEKKLGSFLESRVDSVWLQLEQLINGGYQEMEAFEVVRDQILLMT